MAESRISRLVFPSVVLAAAFCAPGPSAATPPDVVFDLPAGQACSDFDLRVEIRGGNQVFRQFFDKNGNLVRMLSAGRGSALSLINLNSGAVLSVRPNGSVTQTKINPDGSSTVTSTGHNILILFPTDVPAGPSTTQYVGRLVYTVDTSGVFTVQGSNAKSSDICAALSG